LQILNLSQLRFSCRSEYGSEFEYDAPAKILEKARHGLAEFDDQQLIVVSQVLANDINIGYEEITNILVQEFNGVKIRNLRHLAQLVDCKYPSPGSQISQKIKKTRWVLSFSFTHHPTLFTYFKCTIFKVWKIIIECFSTCLVISEYALSF
jgi:hypothetical protein